MNQSKSGNVKSCYQRLEEIVSNGSNQLLDFLLQNISFLTCSNELNKNLITLIIEEENFNPSTAVPHIDNYFLRNDDFPFFRNVVDRIISTSKDEKIILGF